MKFKPLWQSLIHTTVCLLHGVFLHFSKPVCIHLPFVYNWHLSFSVDELKTVKFALWETFDPSVLIIDIKTFPANQREI